MDLKSRVEELLAQMTLEEKAGLCSGEDMWHTKGVERLGIPAVMMCDGPNGLRKQEGDADHLGINDSIEAVCFPSGAAAASSFDPRLLADMGEELGRECRAVDVQLLLGPAVNIKRSPLCGRNFEYYSEDPFLSGQLAAAYVEGLQSQGVGASIKHFAANNQELRRMTSSSNMSERTLREIYLPPFEQAVKRSQPATVMCSYNRINGVYASENEYLMNQVLRDEWGFRGAVVTDWGAVNDRVKGLAAGIDLEMPGSWGMNDRKIVEAVRQGFLEEAVLDRAAARMLGLALGVRRDGEEKPALDLERARGVALRVAVESAVLLKNDGLLPLQAHTGTAYIGVYAKAPRYQGGGSAHVHAHRVSGALSAARSAGRNVVYAEGFADGDAPLDESMLREAVEAAHSASAAVIFAGLPECFESEGYDRRHMRLPACQNQLIEAVSAVQPNTVVVLHNGSPVECPWADKVAAVLEMYLGGEAVGEAADALLWGDANPCGRLAETFPVALEDTPASLNYGVDSDTVEYSENVFVGYRYYDRKNMAVRWPFGHGLSYTDFTLSNLRLSAGTLTDEGEVGVSVDVTNTGLRPGKDVVQMYVGHPVCRVPRPLRELRGIAKVELAPGETKTVSMTLTARSVSYWEERLHDWYAPSGEYTVSVGHSSRDLPLEIPVNVRTEKEIPLAVNADTCLGDIYCNPYAAPVLRRMLAESGRVKRFQQENMDRTNAGNPGMMQAMIRYVPLRALKSFARLDDAALDDMIAKMNEAVCARRLLDGGAERQV